MRDRFDHTGIADQDIKPPEGSDRAGYGGVDLGVAGDVAGDGDGGGADLVCEGGDGITVARQEGDICPGWRKRGSWRRIWYERVRDDGPKNFGQIRLQLPRLRQPGQGEFWLNPA